MIETCAIFGKRNSNSNNISYTRKQRWPKMCTEFKEKSVRLLCLFTHARTSSTYIQTHFVRFQIIWLLDSRQTSLFVAPSPTLERKIICIRYFVCCASLSINECLFWDIVLQNSCNKVNPSTQHSTQTLTHTHKTPNHCTAFVHLQQHCKRNEWNWLKNGLSIYFALLFPISILFLFCFSLYFSFLPFLLLFIY